MPVLGSFRNIGHENSDQEVSQHVKPCETMWHKLGENRRSSIKNSKLNTPTVHQNSKKC